MMPPKNPSDIAREALRKLALRKLAPTPANYQEFYNEIAGIANGVSFPEAHLRQVAWALTAHNAVQQEQLDRLDAAISRHTWQGIEAALAAFA